MQDAKLIGTDTVFTDYEMEMPKAEGKLHTEVYFMQFMWIAEYYYKKKKR